MLKYVKKQSKLFFRAFLVTYYLFKSPRGDDPRKLSCCLSAVIALRYDLMLKWYLSSRWNHLSCRTAWRGAGCVIKHTDWKFTTLLKVLELQWGGIFPLLLIKLSWFQGHHSSFLRKCSKLQFVSGLMEGEQVDNGGCNSRVTVRKESWHTAIIAC